MKFLISRSLNNFVDNNDIEIEIPLLELKDLPWYYKFAYFHV